MPTAEAIALSRPEVDVPDDACEPHRYESMPRPDTLMRLCAPAAFANAGKPAAVRRAAFLSTEATRLLNNFLGRPAEKFLMDVTLNKATVDHRLSFTLDDLRVLCPTPATGRELGTKGWITSTLMNMFAAIATHHCAAANTPAVVLGTFVTDRILDGDFHSALAQAAQLSYGGPRLLRTPYVYLIFLYKSHWRTVMVDRLRRTIQLVCSLAMPNGELLTRVAAFVDGLPVLQPADNVDWQLWNMGSAPPQQPDST